MKKILTAMTVLVTTALILMACSDDAKQNENNSETEENQTEEEQDIAEKNNSPDKKENKSESTSESKKPESNDSNEASSKENENTNSNDQSEIEKSDALSKYSSDEIEYARIWSQLGENQDIDELNVHHISEGEPLNPDDETSANYPEDVIQLAGSRLVDGSVIYSSNGDGTINEYNVPLRWDGKNPAGEDFYKDIIENTEEISIDTGINEKIIELIKLLDID